ILIEFLRVKRLKTGGEEAAKSHKLVHTIGNQIAYINFNNELRLLGDIENLERPYLETLSDSVKKEFKNEDFANGHISSNENRIYITAPANDRLWINETRQNRDGTFSRFWHPPQYYPVRNLSIIDSVIHGHSNRVPETYKLFDGEDDNGNTFKVKMAFAYRNFRTRDMLKTCDEWMTEGYGTKNTKIAVILNYDYEGSTFEKKYEMDLSNEKALFQGALPSGIGTEPIGTGGVPTRTEALLPKFKWIEEFPPQDFFEIQEIYETDAQDSQW
ncbi:unnamed protein product, partial [marine sediment metagenome]